MGQENYFFPKELKTMQDILRFGVCEFEKANLFYGHGLTNSFDEATYLISFALKLPLDYFDYFLTARVSKEEKYKIGELFKQRIETKKPAAYLTHEAFLGEFKFYIDERAIIPRSFFGELLKRNAFEHWIEYPELVNNALDLCTGSGCLAILLAHYYPDAQIDAVDISKDALIIAEKNIKNYQLNSQIHLFQGDLFSALPKQKQYDLIISNPPYVDKESMKSLPKEYQYEPQLALEAGENGLIIIDKILNQAAHYLTPNGILSIEIGHNYDALIEDYPNLPFTWLETESGDRFICLITREELLEAFN